MPTWNPTAQPQALPKVSGAAGNPAGSPTGTPGGPPASSSAKSWAGKNRTTLLAAGAGAVVLLALAMKNRDGAGAGDPAAAPAGTLTTQPQNLAAYDSTSSDVYNALQPQLENIADLLEEWRTNGGGGVVPVPGTPGTSTPTDATPVKVPASVDPNQLQAALNTVSVARMQGKVADPRTSAQGGSSPAARAQAAREAERYAATGKLPAYIQKFNQRQAALLRSGG